MIETICLVVLAAAPTGGRVLDRIAAVVDEQVITLSEVGERADMLRQQAGATAKGDLRPEALESLIDEKLLERQMKDLAIDISDADLNLALDDLRKKNGLGSEAELKAAVEKEGLAWSDYRENMRRQLAQMKLVNLKVRPKVKVSEDEVKRRYAEIAAAENGEREVRASHILVAVTPEAPAATVEAARSKAEGLAKEARKAGVDFAALARASSDGPSRDNGGDLGWFRKGEMVRELEKVAFALPAGQVSDPVRTRFGWHVVKVEEARDVAPRPLTELSDEIRDKLFRDEVERQTQRYLDELKEGAVIEYKMPELAPEKA